MAPDDDAATGGPPRGTAVPNANSPQLLTHLLEMIARGVRSTRGLQEALGIEPRTVRYYLQAAAWLGFAEDGDEARLTPPGLAYVYGGPARRELYADAVAQQPFVVDLLRRTGGRRPSRDVVEAEIARTDPTLAPATVTRRASAIRGLLAPYLDHLADPESAPDPTDQLELPLAQAPEVDLEPPLARVTGRAFGPDVYRYLLCYLLDHGELTLGHVRGLLDRAGASDVPLGAYVDLALVRGDAVRVEERLVATDAAARRRDLAESTRAVILSDRGWREQLDAVRRAPRDRLEQAQGRHRLWNVRLFGHALDPATLDTDLEGVLRDRSLRSFPCTGDRPPRPVVVSTRPWLDAWTERGQVVALPPSLAQLFEGLAGVNRRLRNARHRADAVSTPTAAYRPVAVHGGLLHPGEVLPRSVPDATTLRQRLVENAPYVSLVVALLLNARHDAEGPALVRDRRAGDWVLRRGRVTLGPVLEALDGFLAEQGHVVSRRARGPFGAGLLVGLLDKAGLAVEARDRLALHDGLFAHLRSTDDGRTLARRLEPLAHALGGSLDALHTRARGGGR